MASCATCGSTILFGGFDDGGVRTCSARCREAGVLVAEAARVPEAVVRERVSATYHGPCPSCGRRGSPIDVHVSHRVYSLLVMTSWSSHPEVSCRACGNRRRLGAFGFSLVFGWWGLPWGLVMTPIQLVRNLAGLLAGTERLGQPSAALERAVRLELAAHALSSRPELAGAGR